jgi:hypothetical protein
MIQRIVLIRLTEKFSTEEGRSEVLEYSRQRLAAAPQIASFTAGAQVAPLAEKRWDLALTMNFETRKDVDEYCLSAAHRTFFEDFLQPRLALIKAWNFDT